MSRELSGKVAGAFRLGDALAKGSASTVYAAEQTDTGRAAAVRVFSVDLSRDKAAAAKLVSEVTRATAIKHPGLVPVLDVGTIEHKGKKYLYIAMERLHGESLKARLAAQAGRALPLHVALQTASEVGGALQAIHRAEQVHQRVASGSVFLAAPTDEERRNDPDAEDRVVLLDLGTAQVLALAASEAGKPVAQRPPRPQDDVRGLALLVQEMLGGAETSPTGDHALLPLRARNRKVPARVDAVLRTALGEAAFAETNRERIDSVAALCAALLGAPDATPTLGAWSADGRAVMPRPRTGTSWLWAGGLALVGGLGVGYWLHQSEPALPVATADLAPPPVVTPAASDLAAPGPDLAAPAAPAAKEPGALDKRKSSLIPPVREADALPGAKPAATTVTTVTTGAPAAAPAGPASSPAQAAPAPTAPSAATRTTTTPASGAQPKPAGTPPRANEVK